MAAFRFFCENVFLLWVISLFGPVGPVSGTQCFSDQEREALEERHAIPPVLDRTASPSVVLHESPWAAHKVTTQLASILIREWLGYSVTKEHDLSVSDQFARVADGRMHGNFEVWPVGKSYYFATHSASLRVADLGVSGTSGWYAPSFLLDQSCYASDFYRSWTIRTYMDSIDMPTFPNVSSSLYFNSTPFIPPTVNSPLCVPADDPSATPSNTCFEFLHMNPWYDWGIIAQQIRNLKAPMAVVYLPQETLEQVVMQKIAHRQPTLFYHWEPTVFVAKHPVTRVLLPVWHEDCYNNYSLTEAQHRGFGSVHCDFPPQNLKKIRTAQLERKRIFRDFANFFDDFRLTTYQQMAIMEKLNTSSSLPDDTDVHQAACSWLKENPRHWIDFIYNRPFTIKSVPDDTQRIIMAISALLLCSSVLLAGLVFCYRTTEVVRAGSVEFIYPIIASASGGFISALILSINPQNELVCRASLFTLSEATVALLVFGGAKIWRVLSVFLPSDGKLKGEIRSNTNIALRMALVVAGNVMIDLLWLALDPPLIEEIEHRSTLAPSKSAPYEVIRVCRLNGDAGGLLTLSFVYKVCVLFWALFIAFKSHKLPGVFNDAKAIAVGLYNIAVFSAVALPLLLFVDNHPEARFLATTVPPLYCPVLLLSLLLGPRLYSAITGVQIYGYGYDSGGFDFSKRANNKGRRPSISLSHSNASHSPMPSEKEESRSRSKMYLTPRGRGSGDAEEREREEARRLSPMALATLSPDRKKGGPAAVSMDPSSSIRSLAATTTISAGDITGTITRGSSMASLPGRVDDVVGRSNTSGSNSTDASIGMSRASTGRSFLAARSFKTLPRALQIGSSSANYQVEDAYDGGPVQHAAAAAATGTGSVRQSSRSGSRTRQYLTPSPAAVLGADSSPQLSPTGLAVPSRHAQAQVAGGSPVSAGPTIVKEEEENTEEQPVQQPAGIGDRPSQDSISTRLTAPSLSLSPKPTTRTGTGNSDVAEMVEMDPLT